MPEIRRKFDPEFREGAVRIVRETKKPIAVIARDLGVNPGTLGNWVDKDKAARGEGDGPLGVADEAELKRLRSENAERRAPQKSTRWIRGERSTAPSLRSPDGSATPRSRPWTLQPRPEVDSPRGWSRCPGPWTPWT